MTEDATPIEGIPHAGDTIGGKYRVERDLAAGGMGAILLATDLSTGDHVAVKVMLPAAMEIEGAVTRFEREARAAAGILSEHVVRIFHVGELPNGAPFMVMEYLEGKDLGEVVGPEKSLKVREAADYVLQTCEAMAEAHKSGIVHRDLKPSNLFLLDRPDGSKIIKVLDFGISKFSADSPAIGKDGASLTATRTMMGSPLYMSPEQVRSAKNVDRRSDIWSLGVILYELLSGRLPFEADNAGAICAMIVADAPVPLRWMNKELPENLEKVVMRCLAKEPAERYQDVAELAAALRPFASNAGHVAAAQTQKTMENASGILPTLHAAPIKLDLSARAAAAPMSKATIAATPNARRTPSSRPPPALSSRPPPANSSPPPANHLPKKEKHFGRNLVLLGIFGALGFGAWKFRAPIAAKVESETAAQMARMSSSETTNVADADVMTPVEDNDGGVSMTTFEIDGAVDESTMLDADVTDDGGDDEEEEDDDGGLLAAMRGDSGVTTSQGVHPLHHPTKPPKKKKRKR
ncbi:MAG: serine/threonine-protein kinase [Polyangiaceae bacterium]